MNVTILVFVIATLCAILRCAHYQSLHPSRRWSHTHWPGEKAWIWHYWNGWTVARLIISLLENKIMRYVRPWTVKRSCKLLYCSTLSRKKFSSYHRSISVLLKLQNSNHVLVASFWRKQNKRQQLCESVSQIKEIGYGKRRELGVFLRFVTNFFQ